MNIPSPRGEWVRGPARGDPRRGHRSAEWWRQHDDALTRPCPLEVQPRSKHAELWRCDAPIGEPCVRYPSRAPLEHLPAHNVRLHPSYAPATTDGATP